MEKITALPHYRITHLFLVVLLSSQFLRAQNPVSINYNLSTNTVSVKINPCDICILGGEEFVPYCECTKKAQDSCSAVSSSFLKKFCILDYQEKNCKNLPVSTKKISSWNYGMTFCYDVQGGRPTFRKPCVNTQGGQEGSIIIPDWNPPVSPSPLPTNASGCIYFHVVIFFSNGETCHFTQEKCFSNNY